MINVSVVTANVVRPSWGRVLANTVIMTALLRLNEKENEEDTMTETTMRQDMRRVFGRVAQFTRIETGVVSPGALDDYARTAQHDLWLEYKVVKKLKTNHNNQTRIRYEPGQQKWARAHQKKGGHCFLVVCCEKTGIVVFCKDFHDSIGEDDFLLIADFIEALDEDSLDWLCRNA